MRYYFAPMEGVTDWIYRDLHHRFFPGIDRYYTPFLSPGSEHKATPRESREIPPAETLSYSLVPQILTKHSEDFVWMMQHCRDLGYQEVNLNLGCPSGTVTAKGKGSGMLRDPDALDAMLYEIFSRQVTDISVKTRIGYENADEFTRILEIYNRYPIKELTVHPRVRQDFYKGKVNMDVFSYAAAHSRAPVCFNGNLCSAAEIAAFHRQFPQVEAVMLGRGLIGNPGMLCKNSSAETLQDFMDALFEAYSEAFGSARNAMFRMKENWRYVFRLFGTPEKLQKRLRKATDESQYREIAREVFSTLTILPDLDPDW